MRFQKILATAATAAMALAVTAGPAAADHTKGKKYLDASLTREAAVAAEDPFGVAPAGSSGEGAFYLNHGQDRFCAFLDFDLPDGVTMVALHVHEKAPGTQNGGVVIQLSDLISEDGQSTAGCVTADREFLRGILSSPDDYYVNAHTNEGLSVIRTEFGRS